jgi:hypothetical protein
MNRRCLRFAWWEATPQCHMVHREGRGGTVGDEQHDV